MNKGANKGANLIPAPRRAVGGTATFALRSGAVVALGDATLTGIVERFCADVARYAGLELVAQAGGVGEPAVRIELAQVPELDALPPPIGIDPAGDAARDEGYSLVVERDGVMVRAPEAIGVARALTTLVQLAATAERGADGSVTLPSIRIVDAPRFAWRELVFDVARTHFTSDEVRRVIDLAALYKFNVLALHLTDDQGWRLPVGRPERDPGGDEAFYTEAELRELIAYAEDRFVTVVPEVDFPGHVRALFRLRPELQSGRNMVEAEPTPGWEVRSAWLDPDLAATWPVVEEVWRGVADIFPSSYVNIGGDEAFGMPDDLYRGFMHRFVPFVRSLNKRTVGWQESVRAITDADHVIGYWISGHRSTLPVDRTVKLPGPPEVAETYLRSREDIDAAVAHSMRIRVLPLSNAYLDRPYAEPSTDTEQEERRQRVGQQGYPRKTIAEMFEWDPATALDPGVGPRNLAGAGCAIWCETIRDFGDLTFLLLPRLCGVAQKAWGDSQVTWEAHSAALPDHAPLWSRDGLTWFRSSVIDW